MHQDTAFWPKLAPNAINFWLAWPRAIQSLRDDIHLNVFNNSYDRLYICTHSVEIGT
jgi:hypothetical protein